MFMVYGLWLMVYGFWFLGVDLREDLLELDDALVLVRDLHLHLLDALLDLGNTQKRLDQRR